jgi:TolB-like protein/class 3 adenylate cyclase/Flp pilus assembly protein TadD
VDNDPVTDAATSAAAGGGERPHVRELVVVVYADIVAYSRLIGQDEEGTLSRLQRLRRELIFPTVAAHQGRVVHSAGDCFLLEFAGAREAVSCAVAIQRRVPGHDDDRPELAIRFRMGVNVADVLRDASDIHGDGVNIAARIQTVCPPGGISVSRPVHDHVAGRLDVKFEPLGEVSFKNIARPVEVFVVRLGYDAAASPTVVALPNLDPGVAPRISLAVMPFRNLGDDAREEYLADGITDDLTTDLSRIPDAFVTGAESAYTYKGRSVDARTVGAELGVRYLVQGSTRRIGSFVRVNVQLVSTETGGNVWADRFDQEVEGLAGGQDEIVNRIRSALGVQLVDVELARHARLATSSPTAFELVLRARSLLNQPASEQRRAAAMALFERALEIEPSSVPALVGLANVLSRLQNFEAPPRRPELERAERLVAAAEALEPASLQVVLARAQVLLSQERWGEAVAAYRRVLNIDSNAHTALESLAFGLLHTGRTEEAIPLYLRFIRSNPRDPNIWWAYEKLGQALLASGRYDEAIPWYQRALEANPEGFVQNVATQHRMIGAAYALTGRMAEARAEVAEAAKLSPWRTARFYTSLAWSPAMALQMAPIADALRAAGMRDGADEYADWGIASTADLHIPTIGLTPTSVPGGAVITTPELVRLVEEGRPVILDINQGPMSLPGAVRLRDMGSLGDSVTDRIERRLRLAMRELMGDDMTRPIVTVGWNAERWGARNLALRLIALGYTDVRWYRGGREAWEINGQKLEPLTEGAW